jgi:dTDP-4-amino-4,6-dideoxygalactose transaminase
VDIDPCTYNMSVEALLAKLVQAEKQGCLPKIVVPVHFAGQSCDMRPIRSLADRYGFHIIEDASHAVGGRYFEKPIGGCQYSDITVFSFHPVKIITTGEGGMALTRDSDLYHRMTLLRSHGITRDSEHMSKRQHGAWYYEQIDLGFNFRMTDIHAALGWSQLQRLEQFIERRHRLADRYDIQLNKLPLQLPARAPESRSALHLYVVRMKPESGRGRREVFDALRAKGIGVNVHYIPVHLQPYYRSLGFKAGDFPEAERYYDEAISLPLYPGLDPNQQDFVIQSLHACFAGA